MVDHVLLAVRDLDEGTSRLEREYGLLALDGGRHPGRGTANRLVPLGSQYLELIAVVDPEEAARTRLGQRVATAVSEGRTLVDWALRTEDMEALRARLLREGWNPPAGWEGSRERPNGEVLRWQSQELEPTAGPTAIPFVIEWQVPEGQHPGEMEARHPGGARRLSKVVVGARDPAATRVKLTELLGHSDLYTVVQAERDGLREVVIDGERGTLTIR